MRRVRHLSYPKIRPHKMLYSLSLGQYIPIRNMDLRAVSSVGRASDF